MPVLATSVLLAFNSSLYWILLGSFETQEYPDQVQEFVTGLVDNTRTSYELEVILNHNPDGEPWQVTSSWLNLEWKGRYVDKSHGTASRDQYFNRMEQDGRKS